MYCLRPHGIRHMARHVLHAQPHEVRSTSTMHMYTEYKGPRKGSLHDTNGTWRVQ